MSVVSIKMLKMILQHQVNTTLKKVKKLLAQGLLKLSFTKVWWNQLMKHPYQPKERLVHLNCQLHQNHKYQKQKFLKHQRSEQISKNQEEILILNYNNTWIKRRVQRIRLIQAKFRRNQNQKYLKNHRKMKQLEIQTPMIIHWANLIKCLGTTVAPFSQMTW